MVGVPYHNRGYLEGQTEKVFLEDLGAEEFWKAEDLLIPVYNTEDGALF
jgi:fatty acid synthase subunit beta